MENPEIPQVELLTGYAPGNSVEGKIISKNYLRVGERDNDSTQISGLILVFLTMGF